MLNRIIRADIDDERYRQDQKYGGGDNDYPVWMIILGEEVGEACQQVLNYRACRRLGPMNTGHDELRDLRKELVQVAAVAVAAIEQIDKEMK